MTLLDTHILVWWTSNLPRLSPQHLRILTEREPDGLAVSAFSFWEVAMLVQRGRVDLASRTVEAWLAEVTAIPTLTVVEASPEILIASTVLPGEFHGDPADRIIVATARVLDVPLMTADRRILDYTHVQSIPPT